MENNNTAFLEKLPEFLTMITNVSENGFFQRINVAISANVDGMGISLVKITGEAKIPLSKEDKVPGIKVLVDVVGVLSILKDEIEKELSIIQKFKSEIKTEAWSKWNKEGTKIIGQIGYQTNFELMIFFN